jgi:hypothetical protein
MLALVQLARWISWQLLDSLPEAAPPSPAASARITIVST